MILTLDEIRVLRALDEILRGEAVHPQAVVQAPLLGAAVWPGSSLQIMTRVLDTLHNLQDKRLVRLLINDYDARGWKITASGRRMLRIIQKEE